MDVSTTYLGMKLKNPVIPSAGPLSRSLDSIKKLEDAGAAAIVMHSLFEEQIAHETAELYHYLSYGTESFAEALTYFPEVSAYHTGPEEYVEHIRKAKEAVAVPVIGSLNGISVGGWIKYAKKIQEAGADALELNIYYIPTDPDLRGIDVEDRYLEVLYTVKETVNIPVAVKLSPFFSSLGHMARRLDNAGANGLILFNRFYQPDINLEALEVVPNVILSTPQALRLPMRWIAILSGNVRASLAATSGIHTAEDVVKMLLVGAHATMMCSALLKNGPEYLGQVLRDLEQWMAEHEYISVEQLRGSMNQRSIADPSAFERANYMKALHSYK